MIYIYIYHISSSISIIFPTFQQTKDRRDLFKDVYRGLLPTLVSGTPGGPPR
jgi:hypothetical protein